MPFFILNGLCCFDLWILHTGDLEWWLYFTLLPSCTNTNVLLNSTCFSNSCKYNPNGFHFMYTNANSSFILPHKSFEPNISRPHTHCPPTTWKQLSRCTTYWYYIRYGFEKRHPFVLSLNGVSTFYLHRVLWLNYATPPPRHKEIWQSAPLSCNFNMALRRCVGG